jgi:hypothetical protein
VSGNVCIRGEMQATELTNFIQKLESRLALIEAKLNILPVEHFPHDSLEAEATKDTDDNLSSDAPKELEKLPEALEQIPDTIIDDKNNKNIFIEKAPADNLGFYSEHSFGAIKSLDNEKEEEDDLFNMSADDKFEFDDYRIL